MKNKICICFAVLLFLTALPVKADSIKDKLSQVGFNMLTKKDAKTEITNLIEKQEKYANKKKYDKLKALYAKDYVNFDGISLDDYIDSFKRTAEMNATVVYKTTINSINVLGNYATVEAIDTADGETKDTYQNIEGTGTLKSVSKSVYYFKKENGDWKIASDMVISEKTLLAYGTAKNMQIELNAPECIGANMNYDVSLKIDNPENSAIIASISSEPIQYPQIKQEDIYRAVKQDGIVERVLTANNDGKNEFAFASVAIAKAKPVDAEKVSIVVDGAAFIASRINVIPKKAKENEQKK